jgi:Flp pilus assembly protein TadG
MPGLSTLFRRLITDVRGAEIAEAAAVLPLMFLMLLGIFWFGQAFSIYGAITRAAQDGARAGALPYCATCNQTTASTAYAANAVTAVQNDLLASKLNPSLAQYPTPQPSVFSCSDGSPVVCSTGASSNFCVQAPIQLPRTPSGASPTGLCGVSVSLRYPYRFWLPFTSINKQTIWIAASARVRMENQ